MECIAIGIDVSKGRADVAIINESGTVLHGSGAYDDTRDGHDRLSSALQDLRRLHPEARFIAGVEATGGYERSWVAFCRIAPQAALPVVVHRLNPLAVKRFLDADLHRRIDDARAAQGIARFLLERRRQTDPQAIPLDGRVVFYRNISGLIAQRATQRQRFQSLLSAANPELVQFCGDGIPDWVLLTCRQYPTAAQLAHCQVKTLAAIPHVGVVRAEHLRSSAKTSTAALTDAGTVAAMSLLVEELLHLDDRIGSLQQRLVHMMRDDPRVRRLDGIPGISPWSAVALVLEIGDPERFADVRQLIAWAGLDPRVDDSGDQSITRGISHRGNARLRAMLFPLVMAAMQHNPIVGDFVRRKMAEGKPKKVAIVAGAAKLLRIIYAILVTQQDFDPRHEAHRAKAAAEQRQQDRSTVTETSPAVTSIPPKPSNDLAAPVSARERRRRKDRASAQEHAAAQPSHGCEVEPQERDRGTTAATSSPTTP